MDLVKVAVATAAVVMILAYGLFFFYFSVVEILSVEIIVAVAAILAANLNLGRSSSVKVGLRPSLCLLCNILPTLSYILITQHLGVSMEITPFDSRTISPSLQMIKLIIPYLSPKIQKHLAIYIKFMEFQNTLSYFRVFHTKPLTAEEMINEFRPYLPPDTFDSIDTVLTLMSMMETMDSDPTEILKNMFSTEP